MPREAAGGQAPLDLTGVERAPQGRSLQPPPTCSELTHPRVPGVLIEGLSPESGRTWGLTSVVTKVMAVKPLPGLSWFGPEATSTVSGVHAVTLRWGCSLVV